MYDWQYLKFNVSICGWQMQQKPITFYLYVMRIQKKTQCTKINTMDTNLTSKKCDFCDKLFSSLKNLKIHINRIHKDKNDHNCGSCGECFSRAEYLKIHIHTIHEGHKDHKCGSCGKWQFDLKRHIHTVHNGHKDYYCG